MESTLHTQLTEQIIGAFYAVYNELGYGFLEKVYQNAMFLELQSRGLDVVAKCQLSVYFKGKKVGEYYPDLIVNEMVIIELKSAETIADAFEAQMLNYLRSSRIEVGLLLNFGKTPQVRRKIYENRKKKVGRYR